MLRIQQFQLLYSNMNLLISFSRTQQTLSLFHSAICQCRTARFDKSNADGI